MDVGNYSKALPLLSSLVRTDKFNQAGVWLKHAECHHMLHDMEAAALSYHRVLALAPRHTDTRLTLATLYSQMGLTEDALALLDVPATEQEEEEEGEGGKGGGEADTRVGGEGGVFVPPSQPQFSVSMFARCVGKSTMLYNSPVLKLSELAYLFYQLWFRDFYCDNNSLTSRICNKNHMNS